VALLRGINLGPSRRVPMGELRERLHEAGYPGTRTYLQSGNIVLDSELGPEALATELGERMQQWFGIKVPVVVRSGDGVEAIVPNETLVTTTVLNHSYSTRNIRLTIPVPVAYERDVERALRLESAIADQWSMRMLWHRRSAQVFGPPRRALAEWLHPGQGAAAPAAPPAAEHSPHNFRVQCAAATRDPDDGVDEALDVTHALFE